jgi:hypothetical protein
MANGWIQVALDGITATPQGSLVLRIAGSQFVLADGNGIVLDNISGFNGVQINAERATFATIAGSPIAGTVTLAATPGTEDPVLTLSGFASPPGYPLVTWSAGEEYNASDLSTGQLTLVGFAAAY